MKVTLFTWGNPSRGDDAVGPWFAEQLHPRIGAELILVEEFQLQVEHLLDCQEGELLLFIDACCDGTNDFHFTEVQADDNVSHTSHALAPAELLGHYRRVFQQTPPPAFQLVVPGLEFELGQPMSAATLACCQRAARFVDQLLATPEPNQWRSLSNDMLQMASHA